MWSFTIPFSSLWHDTPWSLLFHSLPIPIKNSLWGNSLSGSLSKDQFLPNQPACIGAGLPRHAPPLNRYIALSLVYYCLKANKKLHFLFQDGVCILGCSKERAKRRRCSASSFLLATTSEGQHSNALTSSRASPDHPLWFARDARLF